MRKRPTFASGSDAGYALPAVIGIGMVLLILITGSLAVTTSGVRKADTDQDWNGAGTAAYAGVAEYQSRLSNDSTYQKYGNPASTFTQSSSSSVALPGAGLTNPAFGVGAAGTWADIPTGDGTAPTASYRYEVNNANYALSGVIKLRATGRVGDVTRTLVADLKQEGFIDFLYFSDYETQDPSLTGTTNCDRYEWAVGTRASSCAIQFGDADVLNGPVHTNDHMRVCGTTFNGPVTSASTKTPKFTTVSGCGQISWAVNGGPTYRGVISMPPTNAEMKKETRNDLADVPRPGCLYTGPTTITLKSDGTMNVISPYTVATTTAATKAGAGKPDMCGTPGTVAPSIARGSLGSVGGANIPVLDTNLIFVQNVPSVSTDANYWGTAMPRDFTCRNAGRSDEGWTFGARSFPTTNEVTPSDSTSDSPAYGCKDGNVFVEGTFDGAMTIAAENYVYVTNNIFYTDVSSSILGLVGNNAVWVWNPLKYQSSSNYSLVSAIGGTNRTISAAILSVAHTFTVQNFDRGPGRGTLTINGAIAQKFRGAVAQGSSGYAKNYNYDPRFKATAPPKFLSPVSTTYGVTQFASVDAAFTAKGN